MKVLILGYKGMLGRELVDAFADSNNNSRSEDYDLVLWDRNQINISNRESVIKNIGDLKPDIVINAAAYTDVDNAEYNKDLVYKVNGCAVGFLAHICKQIDALFVHFSTDYVFRGNNHLGYKESHPPVDADTVYGKSKALGEKMILDTSKKYYLIRLSWMFGKYGKNFVEKMLQLASERKEIKVVNDQFGNPTYAKDLAAAVRKLIESKENHGVYHITNSGHCSWYDFALKIFKFSGLEVNVKPVRSEEFPSAAKRPTYSMLINTKLPAMRSWQDALISYLVETGRIKKESGGG